MTVIETLLTSNNSCNVVILCYVVPMIDVLYSVSVTSNVRWQVHVNKQDLSHEIVESI